MNSMLLKVFVCVMSWRLDDKEIFSHLIILRYSIKKIFMSKCFTRLANNKRRLLICCAVECSAGHWALWYLHNWTVSKRFGGFGKFKVGSRLLATIRLLRTNWVLPSNICLLLNEAIGKKKLLPSILSCWVYAYIFWHLHLRKGYHDHALTESWYCQNLPAPRTSPNFGTGLCA